MNEYYSCLSFLLSIIIFTFTTIAQTRKTNIKEETIISINFISDIFCLNKTEYIIDMNKNI